MYQCITRRSSITILQCLYHEAHGRQVILKVKPISGNPCLVACPRTHNAWRTPYDPLASTQSSRPKAHIPQHALSIAYQSLRFFLHSLFGRPWPTTRCALPADHCPSFMNHYPLPTIHCPVPAAHHRRSGLSCALLALDPQFSQQRIFGFRS